MANTTNTNPPDVVCSLSTPERVERGLEWSDLGTLSLTMELIDGGVAATFPLEYESKISDLADREASCCGSWLKTNASKVGEVVRLTLTTENPHGLAMIMSMAGFES